MSTIAENEPTQRPENEDGEQPLTAKQQQTIEDLKRIAEETKQQQGDQELPQQDQTNAEKVKKIIEQSGDMSWQAQLDAQGVSTGIFQTETAPVQNPQTGEFETHGWRTTVLPIDGETKVLMEQLDEEGKVRSVREPISLEDWQQEQTLHTARQSIDKQQALQSDTEHQPVQSNPEQQAEQDRQQQAWQSYAGYGEYYQRVNAERANNAKITIQQFGPGSEVTIIASMNVDPVTGKAIDGHDYNPEAQSMRDIEAAWQRYLAETPPEQRFVVFEGDSDEFTDRDTAIRSRTEAGLMMYLADQESVDRTSGEPTNALVAEMLEAEGQPKELTALLFTLREQSIHGGNEPLPEDISLHLYGHLAECGIDGFEQLTDEQKEEFKNDPQKLVELKSTIAKYISGWSEVLAQSGLPPLVMRPDGSVGFESPITSGLLASACNPSGNSELSTKFANITKVRDKHIFDTIARATSSGRKPFVVYGGSHVVSLEPVMQQYYGNAQVLE